MTLPTQDQAPISEVLLSNGNILRAYQCASGTISNICAQLVDGITGANIGNPVAITNSTTAHQVWPQVTPREIFFVNTADKKVYRQPITVTSNTITPGTAAAVPLFDSNSWSTGLLPHYSIDFDVSTNTTYLFGRAKNSINMSPILAGVSFNAQGNAASNSYLNDAQADYFVTVSNGVAYFDSSPVIGLFFARTLGAGSVSITSSVGTAANNRLTSKTLTDNSQVFVWQRQNSDTTWDVLTRRLSSDLTTWLDASEVLVYSLPAGSSEPQPNVIPNSSGGYYIVGREQCPGKSSLGICTREYQNNGTLVNTVVSAIDDAQAQFPTGVVTNGKLFVSACELDSVTGNCTAVVNNANALSPTSVPTITSTDSLATTLKTMLSTTTTTTALNSATASTTLSNTLATSSLFSSSSSSTTNINSITSSTSTASMLTSLMPSTVTPNFTNSIPTSMQTLAGGNTSVEPANNTAAIAGGVVGGAALLISVIGAAIWKFVRGKKDNAQDNEMREIPPSPSIGSYPNNQYGGVPGEMKNKRDGQPQQGQGFGYVSATSPAGVAAAQKREPGNYQDAAKVAKPVVYVGAPNPDDDNDNYGRLVLGVGTQGTLSPGRAISPALQKEPSNVAHLGQAGQKTPYGNAKLIEDNAAALLPSVPHDQSTQQLRSPNYVGDADRTASTSHGSKVKRKKSTRHLKDSAEKTKVDAYDIPGLMAANRSNDDDNAAVEVRRNAAEPTPDAPRTQYNKTDKAEFDKFQEGAVASAVQSSPKPTNTTYDDTSVPLDDGASTSALPTIKF
jgi:hypothetical protein